MNKNEMNIADIGTDTMERTISNEAILAEETEKIKPVTIRLPEKVALDFKNLGNELGCNQAQLIELLLNEYKGNRNLLGSYSNIDNNSSEMIFWALYESGMSDEPNDELADCISFKGKLLYADQNRQYKDASIYYEQLLDDYGLDTSTDNYLIFNIVGVAELSDESCSEYGHRYAVHESIYIGDKTLKNEVVIRNDWYQFADEPSEIMSLLSPYVDRMQRAAIKTSLVLQTKCKSTKDFRPKSIKNRHKK